MWLVDQDKKGLVSVKKSAEELSKLELPKPNDTIDKRIHSKALRLEIALNNPIITFDKNYPLGGIELSNTELIWERTSFLPEH